MGEPVLSRCQSTHRLNDEQLARSRKNLQVVLNALMSKGQVHVAEAIGVHESTVSKMKDGELERVAQMLAAMGLQVVPESSRHYAPDEIAALRTLARKGLDAFGGALSSSD